MSRQNLNRIIFELVFKNLILSQMKGNEKNDKFIINRNQSLKIIHSGYCIFSEISQFSWNVMSNSIKVLFWRK